MEEKTDPNASEQIERLFRAMHQLKRASGWPPQRSGLSRGEFFLLHQIAHMEKHREGAPPERKISDLSAAAAMSKPAVSQMLNSLEKKGLVERVMTKTDRRVVYVRMTEAGREQMAAFAQEMSRRLGAVVRQLGSEDAEALIRIMEKLSRILGEKEDHGEI